MQGEKTGWSFFLFFLILLLFLLLHPFLPLIILLGLGKFFLKGAIGRQRIGGCGTFGRALVLEWFSIGTYKQVSQQEVIKLRKLLTK